MSLLAQDQQLTRRVGAVALIGLGLAIVFFVFIYDQIEWGSHTRLRVYFHTTGGLKEGAAFVVAGRDVGRVESIALSPRGAPGPLNGEEGVAITVAIETEWAKRIVRGGDVFITSRGMLSGKYLEIAPAPVDGPTLKEGDELLGRDPPSLDRVLQRTWDNLTTAAAFAAVIRPEIAALREQIDAIQATLTGFAPDVTLREDLDAVIAEGRKTYDALGGEQGLDRISALIDHGKATLAQARTTIDQLRISTDALSANLGTLRQRMGVKGSEAIAKIEFAIDRVRATIAKVDPLLAQVDALRQHIARGEGSMLKLANDPEFPEDAKELGKILKRQPWLIISRPPK